MTTRRVLAFPRGINVGGNNTVPMPALRAALAAAGFGSPSTVLNSGNVAVTTGLPLAEARAAIERVLAEEFEAAVAVLAFEAADVRAMIAGYPWDRAEVTRQHYAVLMDDLDAAADLLTSAHADPELEGLAPAPIGLYYRVVKGFTTTGEVAKQLSAARFKRHNSVRAIGTLEKLLRS
ncbi:MAG TPA: DUF1697 domain-containing protein [Cellulomonas sp.]|nr:DUF1697 domain-containing protein [Cellulomonas sp.]